MNNKQCSCCAANLSQPDNELQFKLYLVEQTKYNRPGCALSAIEHPNQHYYFCGYACLQAWLFDKEFLD